MTLFSVISVVSHMDSVNSELSSNESSCLFFYIVLLFVCLYIFLHILD